ncbi:MAG: hypothetical protein EBY93_07315, partial [Actinobacteria bacterium]|nr:hypothetical protein [Actinomycetota bacterium]
MVLWSIVYFLRHLVTTDVMAMHWTFRTIVGGVVVWFVGVRSRRALMAVVFAGVLVGVPAWSSSHDVDSGDFVGVAVVVEEPVQVGATRVVLSIEGKRYVAYLYSRVAGAFSQCRVGDQVRLEGVRSALSSTQHGRLASRHVVGVVEVRKVLS